MSTCPPRGYLFIEITFLASITAALSASQRKRSPIPGLSYPFVYECSDCGTETTVTRGDARGLYPGPDSSNAAEVVLEQRGWMHGGFDRSIFCPECVGGTSAPED